MAKPVYVIGGGRHGKVVIDTLLTAGVTLTGVLDPGLEVGAQVFGVPVLGDDHYLDQTDPASVLVVNGVGGSPDSDLRKRIGLKFKTRGFGFQPVRHLSASISRHATMADSAQVMAGAILQNGVVLGSNVVVNTHASLDHGCQIGAHSFVAPGVVLCGDVIVGEGVFLGAGAVVMPEVKIGAGAVIGGGAVVIKHVPAGWRVAGNPADKIS
ncbi:MAG: NeuD/PglB/VioB family sugar acetyltransferase [Rhodospirillaceae bacterium]|nr:NeuD/PglB/VioB family sugar acetyltransferase [Rhodospirillaceae bacterium]